MTYDVEGRRGRTWLSQHGFAGRDFTALLAQRLRARRLAQTYLGVTAVGGALATIAILHAGSGSLRLVGSVVLVAVVLAGRWLARHRRHAIERDVAATLPRRVTHTVPLTAREVIGDGFLLAAALTYLGPLLLLLTTGASGSAIGAVAAVGGVIVGIAALDVVEVVTIVRRPTLADDARSLAIDDALRTDDARGTLIAVLPTFLAWNAVDLHLEASVPAVAGLALLVLPVILSLAAEYSWPARRAPHAA